MRLLNWLCCRDDSLNEHKAELEQIKVLDSCTQDNTPWLSFNGDLLQCKVVKVIDADTVVVVLPFCTKYFQIKCRLTHIDAAETRTRNLDEKKVGLDGKKYLHNLVDNKTIWIRCGNWDKYGRLLGTLYLTNQDVKNNNSINDLLVKEGYAYYYDGKKKQQFESWYGKEV